MSTRTAPISKEELDKKFKEHHVLAPSNRQNITPSQNKSFNDSFRSDFSTTGDENLSFMDHKTVENDPKTPMYRKEYHQILSAKHLSPVPFNNLSSESSKENSPSIISNKPKNTLRKTSLNNSLLKSLNNSTPSSSDKENELLPDIEPSPSKELQVSKIPGSILKKTVTYLDSKTTQKLVKKFPELSTSLDSNKRLNPTKAASVCISPKKNDIVHSYSSLSSSPSGSIRNSSPLTDSLNGNKKANFASPYIRKSSNSSKRKSSLNKEQKKDDEWIDDGSDDDDDDDKKKRSKSKKAKSKSWFSALTNFKFKSLIDPQLPYILSLYLQLIFNVLIVSILLYFIYSFISTVKADVENKVDSYASDIIQEIALCSREYLRNNCQPGKRVVALEGACSQWEKCMNQDPTTVGRAKIGAETFAEIINGFIKPISWKSMTFLFLITVGSLVLTNAAFGTYRNYTQYDNTPYQQPQQQHQNPSQTPVMQTPFQTPYRALHYDPAYTRYYTPKPMSPTSAAIVRHRSRSTKKSRR